MWEQVLGTFVMPSVVDFSSLWSTVKPFPSRCRRVKGVLYTQLFSALVDELLVVLLELKQHTTEANGR